MSQQTLEAQNVLHQQLNRLRTAPAASLPWEFETLEDRCDTPDAPPIQAVLTADNHAGFTLFARDQGVTYPVHRNGRQLRFRTIEQAIDALIDVSGLSPEIVIDVSNWWPFHD